MSRIKRDLLSLVVTALFLWALWPERFTFNMPTQWGRSALTADVLHNRLQLPQGFSIAVYASGLPGARLLRFTETGDLLVSLTHTGRIVLLEHDVDVDGRPDGSHDLLTGLKWPHGIDLYSGWLYVAETHRVGPIRFDVKKRRVSGTLEHVLELPAGGQHAMRTVRFGPDGWLYVSVGSSCNACEERDPRRAALLRARPDGTKAHLYAAGLRNTVGFDWHPGANELYGTDNGRDFLGDDAPPCELNRIELGQFYGWPYANGGRIPDPDFGKDHEDKVRASAAPVHTFGAHTSPLGISFISGKGFPRIIRARRLWPCMGRGTGPRKSATRWSHCTLMRKRKSWSASSRLASSSTKMLSGARSTSPRGLMAPSISRTTSLEVYIG
jgi:glucose/arabinose dehydrogenase